MIPSTNTQLLVAEDWTKLYQSFRNADFQSYDYDTLRRTMITYLRETYPEEFNDYIDSSEYIALIDLIAYLGQNLSFRIDLNARENFLETAQRTDSVIRLAQLISYNVKRNIPANGMLKISSVSTSENVIDSNGLNLANQVIGWNDPVNANWHQQFISIINSAMPGSAVYGYPADRSVIGGIATEQYQFNSKNADLPIFTVSKSINGVSNTFEITGATFANESYIYEETPVPTGPFSFIYQNDNRGFGSANSGFFAHFRQGTIATAGFTINNPVPNEVVGINANGINNTDVWLWQLDANGNYNTLWTRVDSLVGNNVIYNNLSKDVRTLYTVTTRANDQIDLNFPDGSFGDLPKGTFRLFYRQSNGRTYSITPDQMSGLAITIPYVNKSGNTYQLRLTLSLQYTVSNSSGPESLANVKLKAPQTYYTQNRMITAEDYNIAPLSAANNILKIKSINRISSGVSKYYELSDVSGKYSSTDIYGKDGILYKEFSTPSFEFSFTSKNQILAAIRKNLETVVASATFKNFYYEKYPRPQFSTLNYNWVRVTKLSNQSTGYFQDISKTPYAPVQTGYFSNNNASYITNGALIKFSAPIINSQQYYFLPSGELTTIEDSTTSLYKWSKVLSVIGDGSNSGQGALNSGTGPITLSGKISGDGTTKAAVPVEVIPTFVSTFSLALETQIVNLCMSQRNFGLSFDKSTRQWNIIVDSNLDATSGFSLTYQGDTANIQKDASWLVLFQWTGISYKVSYRILQYVFESDKQTAFFVDYDNINYDYVNDTVIKDQIDVLGVNSVPTSNSALGADHRWQIEAPVIEPDGYVEPKKVIVSFYDANTDGQIDNPDAFENIVGATTTSSQTGYYDKFVYFNISADGNRYQLLTTATVTAYPSEDVAPLNPDDGSLFYFYTADVVKTYDAASGTYLLNNGYFARPGRSNIKFHYQHNTGDERRIDPSKSNIIDIYVLTSEYDTSFRNYLTYGVGTAPLTPTSSSLETNFSEYLDPIKSISDTLVYHPAAYQVLFGSNASANLQATFKAVRNSTRIVSDNDLKTRILYAINDFFNLDNWDFGQSFNFTELSTYVLNIVSPDILNFIIVPKNPDLPFGSLFEISCQSNEILISSATTDDIEIIDAVTAASINSLSPVISNTNGSV